MNNLLPFHHSHLFKAKNIPWRPEVLESLLEHAAHPEYSILSWFSDKLEAVYAVKRVHSDVGECVALPCGGNIALHKGALAAVRYWREKLNYRRLQATVRDGNPKHERWLVSLGFKKEGGLTEYEPGIDHHLYGRLI